MERRLYKGLIDVLLGIALISLGILAMLKQALFLKWIFIFFGIVLLENGAHMINKMYEQGLNKVECVQCFAFLISGFIFIFIQVLPMMIVSIAFSLYFVILGIIYCISYFNYRKDHVKRRIFVFILGLFLIGGGVILINNHHFDVRLAMLMMGGYTFLLGINYIIDGIFTVLPSSKKDSLKRRIRIPLLIFLSAIVPSQMLKMVNNHLLVEQNKQVIKNKHINMEIFVHVTPDGFGTMGHVDLCFEGVVYSYGNYDSKSQRLFEAIGDGVLFTVNNKKEYIHFCMEESNKTIFGYELSLNQEQVNNVKSKIEELKNNTYPWYPQSYYDSSQTKDYSSRLYLKTNASFYKFKSGKFKTYFVMGTNCVLLADEIIGKTGSDIIDMNGIIAPGTYQDYLEREYQRESGIVVGKKIYKLT